ncbi:transposase [Candidatus Protochlamydia sp. W-9]|uniref:transposase n=1 Tax=Candidatus Protochlamydia sp. W-9 TaxID=1785087 RepID=UPI00096A3DFC|nr:transposase [Candidatus Protochlamydia sp. W-9]
MKKKFKEQIIKILKEVDSETSLTEVYCKHEVSIASYYQWEAKFGEWMFPKLNDEEAFKL